MSTTELVYLRGSGDVRSDLLGALQNVGYTPHVYTSLEDVTKLCTERECFLLVDASGGEAEASQRFVELSAASMHDIPIIFISRQASRRSAVLKKQFKLFIPIDVPFRMANLLEQLAKLCPPPPKEHAPAAERKETPKEAVHPEQELSEQPAPAAPAEPPHAAPAPVEPPRAAPAKPAAETAKREFAKSIPKTTSILDRTKIVSNLDPANLVSSYGGELLATAGDLNKFDDSLLIPAHPMREVIVRILNEVTRRDEWVGLHSRRVAFISAAIANSLGFGGTRDQNIRITALLLNWRLSARRPTLVSHDLLLDSRPETLEAIARGFEEAAAQIKEQIQDEAIARTIIAIVSVLRKQPPVEEPNIVLDAHCALATELADRACWSTGGWDPYGAYRAIRKMWKGEPIVFESAILGSMNRILVEATASRQSISTFLASHDLDDALDKQAIEEAFREAENLFSGKEHLSLQVADLKPGMRLCRPVVSWDGKLILRANTFLDQDMIRRLWQLAAVRALKPPLQVLAKFGG